MVVETVEHGTPVDVRRAMSEAEWLEVLRGDATVREVTSR